MPLLDDIQVYQKRRVLNVALVVLLLVFIVRLIQLQFIYGEEYGQKAEENSIRKIPKEPIRGNLYDRNGALVVDNRPSLTVTVMPYEFDKKNIPFLAEILQTDTQSVRDRLKRGSGYSMFQPVKIKRDIDFRMLSALEENRDKLPGVDYHAEVKRFYPTRAHASHILGYTKEISETQLKVMGEEYTQGDIVGAAGLESQYEWAVRGKKGQELSMVNARGQVMGSYEDGRADMPAVDGSDLILTMDLGLQVLAESLMTDKRGALVAIDPQDGGILAIVSSPDYELSSLSSVTPPEVWRALRQDPGFPLYNRATLTRYPPGSTFKMILALGALEKGLVNPETRINCTGAFQFGNKLFKDLHVHGSVNMIEAIQRSCNVYFYKLMLRVGLDNWSEFGEKFGFGRLTGIDISEESPGLLPSTAYMNKRYGPKGWTQGFLVSLGIGQGELGVTPVQMACYAMALANKGYLYQPHSVSAVVHKATKHVDTIRVDAPKITIADETWNIVREGMRRVVQEPGGTASAARVKGIQSAGKTGTAQNPHGKDHAWYIGFAPYATPTIAIAVLVENAGFGGAVAAPLAGLCIERYLYGRLIRFDAMKDIKTVRSTDTTTVRRSPTRADLLPGF